jgi:two-component system, NtrC family, sensor kinase
MKPAVIIVDDSLTVRMDLAEAFERAGFAPVLCGTFAEGRAATSADPTCVVVLDVVLPDGDGVELLREIRARTETRPVLMLSTEAEVADRVRALKTGADDYVGKPYDQTYVVSKALELWRARAGGETQGRTRVLLVDDSLTFRETLRDLLDGAGYETLVAETGEEGLRVAADRRPHAMIVDGNLPGMDGPTVIRHVRLDAALRTLPCVLLTASEDLDIELRALDAGADAFVRKDEDRDVIVAKITAALRRATVHDDSVTSLAARKILAIDDSPTYLHELAGSLRGEGYEVILAKSGEQGIEVLAVETVDCILLDLTMPGIGGIETCKRIKAAPSARDIPLLVLTAREDRASMLEALGAGADDFIAKSSDFSVLRARLRAQVRRKQFEDQNRHVREQLLRKEIAETRAAYAEQLELKNRELEAFSYSVSHDLRAPLRGIAGFATALVEDCGHLLDEEGKRYLQRIQTSTRRMSDLVDGLLRLARIGRAPLHIAATDLAVIATRVLGQLAEREPQRRYDVAFSGDLVVDADASLMQTVFENLLGNAWKFTAPRDVAHFEIGAIADEGRRTIAVRDNGVGFDGAHADELFRPFYRMHGDAEFEGSGIGLSTVQRIIARHEGRIWAHGEPDRGATISFTLGAS